MTPESAGSGPQDRVTDSAATVKDAALRALSDYTGVSDPMKPWWNLNMPKVLDIMLPAIERAVCDEVDRLRRVERHAREVMDYLEKYGPSIVPHLMDDDDNSGEFLRRALNGGPNGT